MGERKLVARVKKAELIPGAQKRLDYPPFGVLLVNLGGVPYAIDDTCNHAGESLSKGERDGCQVACPAHGYVFDVRTGHLVEPAGLCDNQRTFEVADEGDHFVVYDEVIAVLTPGPVRQ
jgi:3-phenylpropionate/trans-cinnamate dioxygenase ferredoxin component